MPSEESDFDELMRRIQAGCNEAAAEMYERYSFYIRRVVRSRLPRRLRKQYDSLDFVQSVWASFIQIPPERRTFDTPDDLVGFLARVAYNKIIDVYRRRVRSNRYAAADREVPLEVESEDEEGPLPLPGRHPTPSQVASANEQWELLLKDLPPELQRILELLNEGYSHGEIGDRLGLNSKYIQRFLQTLKGRKDTK
jgi:RNA polymerase sigma-70 factor (ECF subfamily)